MSESRLPVLGRVQVHFLTWRDHPVNFLWPPAHVDQDNTEGVTEQELAQLDKYNAWKATGSAYAMEHATRPATIGLVLSASPLALLAWVGEKLLEWADTPIPMQTILRMISLYWFTSAAARNVYPYRALFAREANDGDRLISETKPLGYSVFQDLGIVPEAWCKQIANLKFRRPHSEVSTWVPKACIYLSTRG